MYPIFRVQFLLRVMNYFHFFNLITRQSVEFRHLTRNVSILSRKWRTESPNTVLPYRRKSYKKSYCLIFYGFCVVSSEKVFINHCCQVFTIITKKLKYFLFSSSNRTHSHHLYNHTPWSLWNLRSQFCAVWKVKIFIYKVFVAKPKYLGLKRS